MASKRSTQLHVWQPLYRPLAVGLAALVALVALYWRANRETSLELHGAGRDAGGVVVELACSTNARYDVTAENEQEVRLRVKGDRIGGDCLGSVRLQFDPGTRDLVDHGSGRRFRWDGTGRWSAVDG